MFIRRTLIRSRTYCPTLDDKSLEEQTALRDGTTDQLPSAPKTGAGLEAVKAAKKSKGGNKKMTNDEFVAIMSAGLDDEVELDDEQKFQVRSVAA